MRTASKERVRLKADRHNRPTEGSQIVDAFLLELKYGFRSLWREKGFAATVLLTFSVCIAANAAES
jgi:hypothetical protein